MECYPLIKHVFLDLDDTVFDFHAQEKVAISETFMAVGAPVSDEILKRYSEINRSRWQLLEVGKLTRDEVLTSRFDILFRELGVDIDSQLTQSIYEYRLGCGYIFMDGAEELLENLHGRYNLYIASNGTATVQDRRIAAAGIEKYFEKIFVSQRIGFEKPSAEFFNACFSEIGDFDKSECIIVGDSLSSDILGGINAGILTCHYNPHGTLYTDIVPDCEIKHLNELQGLLESL